MGVDGDGLDGVGKRRGGVDYRGVNGLEAGCVGTGCVKVETVVPLQRLGASRCGGTTILLGSGTESGCLARVLLAGGGVKVSTALLYAVAPEACVCSTFEVERVSWVRDFRRKPSCPSTLS